MRKKSKWFVFLVTMVAYFPIPGSWAENLSTLITFLALIILLLDLEVQGYIYMVYFESPPSRLLFSPQKYILGREKRTNKVWKSERFNILLIHFFLLHLFIHPLIVNAFPEAIAPRTIEFYRIPENIFLNLPPSENIFPFFIAL